MFYKCFNIISNIVILYRIVIFLAAIRNSFYLVVSHIPNVCMYVFMYVCMYVCIYACMHVCMYACMYVGMYVCM